jgi:hypothetical protein
MAGPGWQYLYRIAGCALALEGVDQGLQELAQSLYRGARSSGEVPHWRFALEALADGFALRQDQRLLNRAASLDQFFQEVEWHLTQTFMAGLGDLYQVHASAVGWGDKTLVLCGAAGTGKTSLSLALALEGAMLFTDEVALLDQDLVVHPFPRDLIVHQGTEALFPELGQAVPSPPWKVFPEYRYLSPLDLGQESLPRPLPCGRLVFPRYCPGAGIQLRPLGQSEAVHCLLEQSFNLGRWGEKGVELLGRLVEQCPACQVVFGQAREAAGRLLSSEIQS